MCFGSLCCPINCKDCLHGEAEDIITTNYLGSIDTLHFLSIVMVLIAIDI